MKPEKTKFSSWIIKHEKGKKEFKKAEMWINVRRLGAGILQGSLLLW